MIDLFAFEQVIPELLAQFYGDIAKGAFATDKFLEVVVNAIPFLILFSLYINFSYSKFE